MSPRPLRLPTALYPQKAEGKLGDPHSWRMIDRAAARRKASCDEREKEKECVPMSPFVLLTTSPLVFHGYVHTIES